MVHNLENNLANNPNSFQNKRQTAIRFLSQLFESIKLTNFNQWFKKQLREKFIKAFQTDDSSIGSFPPSMKPQVNLQTPADLMAYTNQVQKFISQFVDAWATAAASVSKQTAQLIDKAVKEGQLTEPQGQVLQKATDTTLKSPSFLGKVLQCVLKPTAKPEKPVLEAGSRDFQETFDRHWNAMPTPEKDSSEDEQCYQNVANTLMGRIAAAMARDFIQREAPVNDFERIMSFMAKPPFRSHAVSCATNLVDSIRHNGLVLGDQFIFEKAPSPHVSESFFVRSTNGPSVTFDKLFSALEEHHRVQPSWVSFQNNRI